VALWDELKVVLARLRDEQPGALQGYPDPGYDEDRQPPFEIRLAPWATATAENLHNRFGQGVDLVVGALAYPPGRQLLLISVCEWAGAVASRARAHRPMCVFVIEVN
jgi:hypothetical protein